jgi:hypothetical protein
LRPGCGQGTSTKCGGEIRKARGQYGRQYGPFLGCSEPECQTAWDANGWKFEGKRELYDHGNSGWPDQYIPVRHPGDSQHHEIAVWTGGGKHDFTPEKPPDVVVQEIGVWEQLVGLVTGEPQHADWEMAS